MNLQKIYSYLRHGKFVVVYDDRDRENEYDLVVAAQKITVQKMAFLISHTSGIVCVAMTPERLRQLALPLLHSPHPANFDTPFTMPVDYNRGVKGGVSARERVSTVRALIKTGTLPNDLGRPGHVFPLRAHPRGLAGRQGHTEATVELMCRAKLYPAAVFAELLNDDGTLMRGRRLQNFVQKNHLLLCSVSNLLS